MLICINESRYCSVVKRHERVKRIFQMESLLMCLRALRAIDPCAIQMTSFVSHFIMVWHVQRTQKNRFWSSLVLFPALRKDDAIHKDSIQEL